ncbi:hypothetical protein [Pontibacillus yanchengensis]|uniref:Uncharacterized protein n=1 Tax=Pontibacillus yanchengensis Y32 TaxID=1385514 RepID=A0A0A2TI50_9BACI|nr:hypothetical protein [Pontibacillus yanchengensis]KGP73741.1 hypothetical protein N782_02150 [Pontibacillus yanchengensis Y32]
MVITKSYLEANHTILQAISKANLRQELKTKALLQQLRKDFTLSAPNCLFELRNGVFVGTGDYIESKDGEFYFCSANGSSKPVDVEFIYEFCHGCAKHLEDYPRSILRVK